MTRREHPIGFARAFFKNTNEVIALAVDAVTL
jgi:hypothetical protein